MLGRFTYLGPTLLETMAQVHMSDSFRITRYCSKKRKHCAIAGGSLDRLVKVTTINCIRAVLLFDKWSPACVAGVLFSEREEKLPKRARNASRRLSASKPVCKNSFLVLKVFTRKMSRKIKEYLWSYLRQVILGFLWQTAKRAAAPPARSSLKFQTDSLRLD